MAKIILSRPHTLGYDAACAKLSHLIARVEERYGVGGTVSGDSAQLKGRGVKGTAKVSDKSIDINLKLGLPASLVASKIEEGIGKAITEHFAGQV